MPPINIKLTPAKASPHHAPTVLVRADSTEGDLVLIEHPSGDGTPIWGILEHCVNETLWEWTYERLDPEGLSRELARILLDHPSMVKGSELLMPVMEQIIASRSTPQSLETSR